MASTAIVSKWPENASPAETDLRKNLLAQGLQPYRWSNGPGDIYAPHRHPFHKVIFVVDGSITFGLPEEGAELQLTAGDRLDLPAGVLHDAHVGARGVVCLEAHRERGAT